MVKSDYDRIIPDQYRERLGRNHYTFALMQCMSMIQDYRERNKLTEPFDYVFESGTKGNGEIMNIFERISRDGPVQDAFGLFPDGYSFQSKLRVPQLQTADILAWESYRHMLNSVVPTGGPARAKRRSFQELVRDNHVKASFFHSKNLLLLMDRLKAADANRVRV